jgi:hypothetical protein
LQFLIKKEFRKFSSYFYFYF